MKKDKLKVCVISSYAYIKDYINYGSLLQYYALQTALQNEGVEPYWLRYVLPERNRNGFRIIKSTAKKCLNPLQTWKKYKVHTSFFAFISSYLIVSKQEYNDEMLNCQPPVADLFITGSDQVWGGKIKANYLTFVPKGHGKISYAASFGKSDILQEQLDTITHWINDFDAVSVRELSGVKICKKMGVNANQVLDPTLLINADDYPFEKSKLKHKFIFGYFLNVNKPEQLPLDKINQYVITEKKILRVAGGVTISERLFKKQQIGYYSPEKWLGMYRDADKIFTNTFHGTVFAIIFHKPFLVFLQKGISEKQNERLIAILELFHLKERIYIPVEDLSIQVNREIDWESVDEVLQKEKEASLDYLQRIFK